MSYIIKDNVLNRAMFSKLKKTLSLILLLALSVNFLPYSSKDYSPPKTEAISDLIVNCSSHKNQLDTSNIVQLITTGSGGGSARECFCYDGGTHKASSVITLPTVTLTFERHSTFIVTLNESLHIKDTYKNLPIRSPPAYVA
jgi:hypothetical protein